MWICAALFALCTACATDIEQHLALTTICMDVAPETFRLNAEVQPRTPSGFRVAPLAKGTLWTHVGDVDLGKVLRPTGRVLQLKSGNAFEAWIVVAGDQLIAFYLPSRGACVFSEPATPVSFTEESRP